MSSPRTPNTESCTVCGAPIEGEGFGGTCSRCLLTEPDAQAWEPAEPPTAEAVAESLRRYEIGELLGTGALGAVYSAIDRRLERKVAIKVMADNPDNVEYAARFHREATTMAKLTHPNIVAIHDYGTVESLHYLVMERMVGSLDEEMGTKRRLQEERAIEVFLQLCRGLAFAHSNGIVHRDIKPGNVLLDHEGNAKLSDFGLAKGVVSDEFAKVALTRTRMAMGTPLYMAPEQMEGARDIDRRADIYSIAAVLFEMLTGEQAKDRSRAVSAYDRIPARMAPALDRALQQKPQHRYETIEAVGDAIEPGPRTIARPSWWRSALAAAIVASLTIVGWETCTSKPTEIDQEPTASAPIGLPLRNFDEEVELGEWKTVASYDFSDEVGEREDRQGGFNVETMKLIKDGQLRIQELDEPAWTYIKREEDRPAKGVALHIKYRATSYPSTAEQSRVIIDLSLGSHGGIFFECTRWSDSNPRIVGSARQPFAPPGVIEPILTEGETHDVWLMLTEDYRLWIDGEPVYRGKSSDIETWVKWGPEMPATLEIRGFRGEIDFVQIYEMR